jgi:hypothetical protein
MHSEQRQKYTVAGIRTSKVMRSLVHVELDENDMITHLEDRWFVSHSCPFLILSNGE